MEDTNAPDGRPRRGWLKMRKIYRHKYFDWSKKVVTGQSQNAKKSCFKSPTQNAKKDILGHVAIVAHLRNILRGWGIIAVYTKIWRYIVWIFSNFKRNIFGWKVVEHRPSVLPSPRTFGIESNILWYFRNDVYLIKLKYFFTKNTYDIKSTRTSKNGTFQQDRTTWWCWCGVQWLKHRTIESCRMRWKIRYWQKFQTRTGYVVGTRTWTQGEYHCEGWQKRKMVLETLWPSRHWGKGSTTRMDE